MAKALVNFRYWICGLRKSLLFVVCNSDNEHIAPRCSFPVSRAVSPMLTRLLLLLAIPAVAGSGYTGCDPTVSTNCAPVDGFSSPITSVDFNKPYPTDLFDLITENNTITQNSSGLHITIDWIGDEPHISTNSTFTARVLSTKQQNIYFLER